MGVVRKSFGVDGSLTIPAGVKQVRVSGFRVNSSLVSKLNAAFAIDYLGNLYSWGLNGNGQLGDNSVAPKSSPVAVVGGLKFASISDACGITTEGRAFCWGQNLNGEIGDNTVTGRSSPVAVVGGLKFKKLTTGVNYRVGLAANGDAYGWGVNTFGFLGDNSITSRSSPVLVVGGLKFKDIATDKTVAGHTVAITSDGSAYCWGSGSQGQLGDNNTAGRSSPVAVVGGLKFRQVAAGGRSSLGITEDGTPYAWGRNAEGQLGDGTNTNKSSPVLVLGGLKFKEIAAGQNNTFFGLTAGGDIYGWGLNASAGTVGDGTIIGRSSPVLVVGGLKFVSIGGQIAVTADGNVYTWGQNSNGEMGDGTQNVARSSPVLVIGGFTFAADPNKALFTSNLEVTPNQTYQVKVGNFAAFGPYGLGQGADFIVVEYNA